MKGKGPRGPLTPEQEAAFETIVEERLEGASFYRLVGLSVSMLAPGEARLELKASPGILDSSGNIDRGAVASLADAASGVAVATCVTDGSRRVVTIEQKVNFLEPAGAADLLAVGTVIHRDGDVAVSESEIRDREGALVARSTATHMLVPPVRDQNNSP